MLSNHLILCHPLLILPSVFPSIIYILHLSWSLDKIFYTCFYVFNELLSHLSCVRLCATPEMAAHQAPPTLGFSRQEHRSGLPFPSPVHESAKWKWKVKLNSLSLLRLLVTPWTAAHQAPPSMGFSRQEYWNGLPLPSPYYTWKNLFIWFLRKKFICIAEGEFFFFSLSLFTRWSMPKSDWLYSLQPKMEKLYIVSKNKTGSWLWLRSWTPYCQIQT